MNKSNKGKQATKGLKQIAQENASTLVFYRNMMLGSSSIFLVVNSIIGNGYPWTDTLLLMFATVVMIICYQFLSYMSKATYSDGKLVDPGTDLNMENGIAEHVKDIIILTSCCQVLSLISNYFYLLWLAVPCRAFYMLWVNILSPYIFQPAPVINEEKAEKKQRKLMRRQL